jgi:hypothetical protein
MSPRDVLIARMQRRYVNLKFCKAITDDILSALDAAGYEVNAKNAVREARAEALGKAIQICKDRAETVRGVLESKRHRRCPHAELAATEARATDAEFLARTVSALKEPGT